MDWREKYYSIMQYKEGTRCFMSIIANCTKTLIHYMTGLYFAIEKHDDIGECEEIA